MNEFIQEISYLWLPYFSLLLIQNSLFVGLILLLLKVLKHSSARFKYYICTIATIKLILPPFLSYNLSLENIYTNFAITGIFKEKILPEVGSAFMQTSSPLIETSATIGWIEMVFILWIAGVLISLFTYTSSFVRIIFTLRNAQMAKKETYYRYVSNEKIRVYISEDIPMPLTLALFPNRIYVPIQWNEWDARCRQVVVKHEETHLQRRDNLIQILQVIAQALFFFHPLVYLLSREMNLYREMACDDAAVLNGIESRIEYSKCLTEIAEKAIWTPRLFHSTSAFFYKKGDLSNRINYQMKEGAMLYKSKMNSVIILSLLIISIPFFSWYAKDGNSKFPLVAKMQENVIELRIFNKDDIRINGNTLSMKEFKSVLSDISEELDDPILHLKFDNKVTMKLVFTIENTLRDLDLLNVRFMGDEDHGLNLLLPNTASEEQLKKIKKENILTLLIISDGRIKTDDLTIDASDLEQFLKENLKKNELMIISIKANEDVVYKDYIKVLDHVGKSGCKRVFIYGDVN